MSGEVCLNPYGFAIQLAYFHAKLSDKYPLFFTTPSYLAQCSLSNSTSVNSFFSEKTR